MGLVWLNGFVLDFFSDFRFFWRDLEEILVLCIFVCFSLFCEFLDFLHFREFLVLVGFCSVATAGLADSDNHLHPRTLRPLTSQSFHPTPQHTFYPTTHYHFTTAPYHLSLTTSHPTQRWTWEAQYTHRPHTHGRKPSTHLDATGGGDSNTKVASSRATSGFPRSCASTHARSGCTRHASCVDSKPKKQKS